MPEASNATDNVIAHPASNLEKIKDKAQATNAYVHKNPWIAIGAGIALGTACGFLLASSHKPQKPSTQN